MSSLPAATIEQLSEENLKRDEKTRDALMVRNAELLQAIETIQKQRETIETLEQTIATMRRRLETFEGVN